MLKLLAVATLGCACATDAVIDELDDTPIADLRVPLAGSKETYRFRFFAADTGTIAVAMDVPIGAAMPELGDECPLATFLRVAPDDAIVPPALLVACGSSADAAVPHTAGELDTAHLTLAIGPAAAPQCTLEVFDSKLAELVTAANDAPLVKQCDENCVETVVWNLEECHVVTPFEDRACTQDEWNYALAHWGIGGNHCTKTEQTNCQWVPSPYCKRDVQLFADWGPWVAWERTSPFATTAVHAETSLCGPDSASAYWQDKAKANDAWGTKHNYGIPGNSVHVLQLYAGVSSNKTYLGRYFLSHVNAPGGAHVAAVWLGMVGDPQQICPLSI